MRPQLLDLFGEIIVTHDDVREWVAAVPRLDPDSERGRAYARDWDVPEKVRQAKARGDFEQLVNAARERPAWWWRRFAW